MVLSGLLHWLVSESIFLVSINVLTPGVQITLHQVLMTCGFSPAAMLLVIIAGIFMVVTIVAFGALRLGPGIPLASSCSLAIAAACHPGYKSSNTDISTAKL